MDKSYILNSAERFEYFALVRNFDTQTKMKKEYHVVI